MAFYWTELNTSDPDAARSFYAATMGWAFRLAGSSPDYWLVLKDERVIGGLYGMTGEAYGSTPSHWFSYVEVDDVDEACRTAIATGGGVLREPATIADVGRLAILQDPSGSPIGCIAPFRSAWLDPGVVAASLAGAVDPAQSEVEPADFAEEWRRVAQDAVHAVKG